MQSQDSLLVEAMEHLRKAQSILDTYHVYKRGPSWRFSCNESVLIEDILDKIRAEKLKTLKTQGEKHVS